MKMNEIECPHCHKFFNKYGIKAHIWRLHTEEGMNFNARKNYIKGSNIAWNKGLTKDTDDRIKYQSKKIKEYYQNKPGTFKGKKHSEETKRKISESRIQYLVENPEKVPYLINHSSKKSYPEQIFEDALIFSNIGGWEYNYQNSIYSYDFAFIDLKIDVEIDGETHKSEKVQKIDSVS